MARTSTDQVTWDPCAYVPGLASIRDAARDGDWPGVRGKLDDCPSADALTFAVTMLADQPGIERLLERVVADAPDDVLARAVLGAREVVLAWDARGGGRASTVGARQFDMFFEHLERAERLLIDVCADRPDLAPAWTSRLMTARGLELGLGETRRRYDRLAAHHPHHLAAQAQLLQRLCPKWGGSWEQALGFAREQAAAAAPGSPSGALVAIVHFERAIERDAGAPPVSSAQVRDELVEAALRSVWHQDAHLGVEEVAAHSVFALAFSVGGHDRHAAPHFRVLAGRGARSFWSYYDEPSAVYVASRDEAFAAERSAR